MVSSKLLFLVQTFCWYSVFHMGNEHCIRNLPLLVCCRVASTALFCTAGITTVTSAVLTVHRGVVKYFTTLCVHAHVHRRQRRGGSHEPVVNLP